MQLRAFGWCNVTETFDVIVYTFYCLHTINRYGQFWYFRRSVIMQSRIVNLYTHVHIVQVGDGHRSRIPVDITCIGWLGNHHDQGYCQ